MYQAQEYPIPLKSADYRYYGYYYLNIFKEMPSDPRKQWFKGVSTPKAADVPGKGGIVLKGRGYLLSLCYTLKAYTRIINII